jgi:hypothetical protein
MTKRQLNIRVDEEVAEMARQAAATRREGVSDYVQGLIVADNESPRGRFLDSARQFLSEYGGLLDDIEGAA